MLTSKRFEEMKKAFLSVNSLTEEQFTSMMTNLIFRMEFQAFRLGWEQCIYHINKGVY
jgi:hypothetical protein